MPYFGGDGDDGYYDEYGEPYQDSPASTYSYPGGVGAGVGVGMGEEPEGELASPASARYETHTLAPAPLPVLVDTGDLGPAEEMQEGEGSGEVAVFGVLGVDLGGDYLLSEMDPGVDGGQEGVDTGVDVDVGGDGTEGAWQLCCRSHWQSVSYAHECGGLR
jgi:hypothetical protein